MGLLEIKEAIKQTPISTIVGHYIPLKKSGQNFEGVCPFHQDSHPSLKVNDSKELYKCFACGEAGDSIRFVQNYRNLDFKEAVLEIAEFIGIPTDDIKNQQYSKNPEFEMGLRLNKLSNSIFKKYAETDGKRTRDQFIEQRGLNLETAEKFQIYFAPGNNALKSYLAHLKKDPKEKDLALNVAKKIQLLKTGRNGDYDTFRNRITFPIWDQQGQIRGFGARSIYKDQIPKYLNSSESFLFNKRNILYGLNFALPKIREQKSVILVEGYMDVIALHHHGFSNAVATMGVALSDHNVSLLLRNAETIYFAMDSDSAGIKAMTQINQKFLLQNKLPKLLLFDPYKDPDEFLQKESTLSFQKLLDQAPTFLDYQIMQQLEHNSSETLEDKIAIMEKIYKLLSPLKDSLQATERILQLAQKIGLQTRSEIILEQYLHHLKNTTHSKSRPKSSERMTTTQEAPPPEKAPRPVPVTANPLNSIEKNLLKMFVLHPNIAEDPKIAELLDNISDFEVKRGLDWLYGLIEEVDEQEYLNILKTQLSSAEIASPIKKYIFGLLYSESFSLVDQKTRTKLVEDLLKSVKKHELKNKLLKEKSRQQYDQIHHILNELKSL